MLVYSSSMAVMFLFWLTLGLLIGLVADRVVSVKFDASPRSALSLSFIFILVIVLSLAGWYFIISRGVADVKYARASSRDVRTEMDKVVSGLEGANSLNPLSDQIVRALAQAYLLKINTVANDSALDDQARSNQVILLTDAAVRAARAGVSLSPNDAQNWKQLGDVYQNIAPYVNNADAQAIEAYGKAAELDPVSPVSHTELGKVYILRADKATNDLQSAKTDGDKATAQKTIDTNLVEASKELNKALSLKGDYAPAGYQLALVLDRQGKTKEAIDRLVTVQRTASSDVGVAMQLGLLYYRDDQKEKAAQQFEGAVKLVPTFANARWFLSVVYEDLNRIDDAIAQVEEVLKTNPDADAVKKRLADLKAKKAGESVKTEEAQPLP
jgi:tetratricopeptide (TPR) repeat protein